METVSVPAGTFKARHVVFGGVGGSSEWWLAKSVPGGTVKQLVKNPKSDQDRWEMDWRPTARTRRASWAASNRLYRGGRER